MDIFNVLKNLYTNRKIDWLDEVDESTVSSYIVQRWLVMNDSVRIQTRWLDKYVFVLPTKMYLSLAWSVLPKTDKTPFVKYIKQLEDEEEFDFILSRVRKHLQLADNDYNSQKTRLIQYIKNNMVFWFSYYGIPKKYWKQYYLNFDMIKKFGVQDDNKQKGLGAWGI